MNFSFEGIFIAIFFLITGFLKFNCSSTRFYNSDEELSVALQFFGISFVVFVWNFGFWLTFGGAILLIFLIICILKIATEFAIKHENKNKKNDKEEDWKRIQKSFSYMII